MYNVKVLKYPNGFQYRVYNKMVETGTMEEMLEDVFTSENLDESGTNNNGIPESDTKDTLSEESKSRSLSVSSNRTINQIYYLARSNIWDWFITLTFDPEKVNSFDYDECVSYLSVWLNNIKKKKCANLKYIMVPELHKSGRFHFHGLFADCPELNFIDSGKYIDGQKIYNIGSYTAGFSTASRVGDNNRVTKYLAKYVTKDLIAVSSGRKRYWASRNLDKAVEEDMIIENVAELKDYLLQHCSHASICGSGDFEVTYFEMNN